MSITEVSYFQNIEVGNKEDRYGIKFLFLACRFKKFWNSSWYDLYESGPSVQKFI